MKLLKIILTVVFSIIALVLGVAMIYLGYVSHTEVGLASQTGAVVVMSLLSMPMITSTVLAWDLIEDLSYN